MARRYVSTVSVVVGLFALLSSGAAQAAGYGMAGCGLGALLFKGEQVVWKQILAATTNGTFGNQTFGISTGTLECTPKAAKGMKKAENFMPKFIEANKFAVEEDIARGNGETVAVIADLMGCGDSDAVGPALQEQFVRIFPTTQVSSTEVSGSILSVMRESPALTQSCKNLI